MSRGRVSPRKPIVMAPYRSPQINHKEPNQISTLDSNTTLRIVSLSETSDNRVSNPLFWTTLCRNVSSSFNGSDLANHQQTCKTIVALYQNTPNIFNICICTNVSDYVVNMTTFDCIRLNNQTLDDVSYFIPNMNESVEHNDLANTTEYFDNCNITKIRLKTICIIAVFERSRLATLCPINTNVNICASNLTHQKNPEEHGHGTGAIFELTLPVAMFGKYESLGPKSILYYACMIISDLSILVLISFHILYPALLSVNGKCVVCLSVNILFSDISIMVDRHAKGIFCVCVAILGHFFVISYLSWMVILAFDLARRFCVCTYKHLSNDKAVRFMRYVILGWGFPTIVVGTCLILEYATDVDIGYGRKHPNKYWACWIDNAIAMIVAHHVPFAISMLTTVICFIGTLHGIIRTSRNVSKDKSRCLVYFRIFVVMGMMGVIMFSTSFISSDVLEYATIIVSGLQGAFLVLNYVLTHNFCKTIKTDKRKPSVFNINHGPFHVKRVSVSTHI